MFSLYNIDSARVLVFVVLFSHSGLILSASGNRFSVMDTFSSSRFSTHMRDNLLNPMRQGFCKGVSGFNDLPTSYKYAIGFGATVGVGVLGWCAFQKGKPVEPTSSNSEIDVSQLEQDERTARIDSFFVGQNEGFNKFQEIHDIGPTEVLQSRTHKWILRNYLGNFFLNEVSLLIRQGANPFIPMFRDGGINAFVSIAENIKPEFLLPMLCDEYRSKKGESVRVFSDEEIKDGIKQSLVHLFETTEFSHAFQHILASLLDSELKQTKPGLVFTSQDWEDVVVYAADVEIVHDARYKTCLDIFLKETEASASSSSSSSSCNHSAENMEGSMTSSSSSFSSSAPTISSSLPTSIVGGIQCAIQFEQYNECGVVGYIVRLGKNKYFCSSSRGGLADFVRSKLVKDFALLYVTEDIVEKSLEEAGIYNQWDAFCEEKKAEMLRNKKIRQLPKIAIECGLPKSVDDISASGNTLVLINAINVRITLSYDGYSRSFIVPYTFEYVRKSDFTSFKNEVQEKFREICDINVSSDEIDTYLLQNGFYTSLEQSFGQLEELTYYDKTDMPVQHIISFYVDRHYPRNTLSHVPIISETDSQEEPLSNAAKTYCYYETLKEV